jgi:hypothetical protein
MFTFLRTEAGIHLGIDLQGNILNGTITGQFTIIRITPGNLTTPM